MIKSLLLNIIIVSSIVTIYYFNLLDFLASNFFIWIIFGAITILFIIAFKVLGNPFKIREKKEESEEEK